VCRTSIYVESERKRERECVCVDTYMHTPIYVERETECVYVCVLIYICMRAALDAAIDV